MTRSSIDEEMTMMRLKRQTKASEEATRGPMQRGGKMPLDDSLPAGTTEKVTTTFETIETGGNSSSSSSREFQNNPEADYVSKCGSLRGYNRHGRRLNGEMNAKCMGVNEGLKDWIEAE